MKRIVILAAAGAAILLLLQGQGGDGATAGDDNDNLLDDAMNVFSNWPANSGPYQDTITQAATDSGVPVPILAWLLWKESRYNPNIINGTIKSRVGALGIAQFMPATAVDRLGSVDAALDPAQAIPGAADYLASLYQQTGTWAKALAAYNWGIGNVTRKGLAAAPAETVDYYTTILSKAGGQYA